MLDSLTERLARVVKTMRGQARLTESNTQEMLREVRVALLEADVALPVVREFISRVRDRALGEEVVGSLTPGQALVGVVHRELTALMGGDLPAAERELSLAAQPPAVILLAGLQGAGKTTTAAKLSRWLIDERRKKVLTVSTDVYRPAAIEQLKTVSEQAGAQFFPSHGGESPVMIAEHALDYARRHYFDVLIVDTAGRLAIDEAMMQEVAQLHAAVRPVETLFVVDSMLGQDAVNTARAFSERLPLTGVILTKLDGRRGGKDRRFRALRCGTHGGSRSRHGRCRVPGRGRAQGGGPEVGREAGEEDPVRRPLRPGRLQATASTSTTSRSRSVRCAGWAASRD